MFRQPPLGTKMSGESRHWVDSVRRHDLTLTKPGPISKDIGARRFVSPWLPDRATG